MRILRGGGGVVGVLMMVAGAGVPAAAAQPGVVAAGQSALAEYRVAGVDHGMLVASFADGAVRTIRVALPRGEETATLELQSFEVFAPDASVVVDGMNGTRAVARPDLMLLRGTVVGDPESRVFLGSSPTGVHGFIETGGRTLVISSGPNLDGGAHGPALITTIEGDLAELLAAAGMECTVLIPPDAKPAQPAPGGLVDFNCRLVEVAIETDWEFTGSLFGGSTQASGAYAAMLVAASSEVYRRDLNMGIQIKYLRLWEDSNDPWTAGGAGDQLSQFRSTWNSTMGGVQRDAAHMFSGRGLGGGVAWLGAVCSTWAYALSANLGGSFPYPIQNNSGANWDLMVVSHEWGHNFGAQHTHDLVPAPDLCGQSNCTGANMGTIMSYCHLCSGGMANMRMEFHPQSVAQMDSYLNGTGACVSAPAATLAVGEGVTTIAGVAIDIDVLANDIPINCDGVTISGFGATTTLGGTVERLVGAGPGGRDLLRYTPPAIGTGTDFVTYSVQAAGRVPTPANVQVTLLPLREPVSVPGTLAGVRVSFYEIPLGTASIPALASMTPYATSTVGTINVASTGGVFGTSGRADTVAAAYEGYLLVSAAGLYTLSTESDDGSRLLIGGDVIVENDGLHGMLERSGLVALSPGHHALRVEFFENEGGAGLIARIEGPGVSRRVIPATMLRRDNPCPADLTGTAVVGQPGYGVPDGNLSTDDFFYYIAQFSGGNLAITDLTTSAVAGSPGYGVPNGVLNNDDFFFYLTLFSAGC